MRMFFRKITAVLLLAVTLTTLAFTTSCNRKYDEQEVVSEAKKLLKQAEMLNIVYFGTGISYIESDEDNGYYRQAKYEHLESLGFFTIDELKAITADTFTKEYAESIYSTLLGAVSDGTHLVQAARYYQAYDEETNTPTHIMVYSKYQTLMKDSMVYNYDTITVSGVEKEIVLVSVEVVVTNSEGESQTTEIIVQMIEEDNGWRINNPTYVNYNPYLDKYNELKDNKIK